MNHQTGSPSILSTFHETSAGKTPFLNFIFYLSIIDLQYCVSFKCTEK